MNNKALQIVNRILLILVIPLISLIYASTNVYRPNMHNLSSLIDGVIPFCKYFVPFYGYWFLYMYSVLIYFAVVDGKYFIRLLMSIASGMCISTIIFYVYPTTVVRPELSGADFFTNVVRFVYSHDNPFNCFPSIHVLNSLLVTLFLCTYNKNKAIRLFAVASCISISLSTLFVKQHYVVDAVAALLLGTALFLVFTNDALWNRIPVKKYISTIFKLKLDKKDTDFD